MFYERFIDIVVENQGESFSRTLGKSVGAFSATEDGYWVLKDTDGTSQATGSVTIATDLSSMSFMVGKTDTATLVGQHTVYVHLTDSADSEFDEVIAEYKITYKENKAI